MRLLLAGLFISSSLLGASLACAQPAGAGDASLPTAKWQEARDHFSAALQHFDRQEWSAALAEFLQSRDLYPTRAATKDAAICLRKEGRFDEALAMYEQLLADFADLPAPEQEFARSEIRELNASIGTIAIRSSEPGAAILIDGRHRGNYPLAEPLRVSAGSHLLRVSKEGFTPFELRIDLAGRQAIEVDARLSALTRGGRLRVTETSGRALDLLVDNVVVGKTPWEGPLSVGLHVLVLRGEHNFGTQPATAPVRLNELATLSLAGEELGATARIEPSPVSALVSIDGVEVGRGTWEGNLRPGPHVFEVGADGFLPYRRAHTLVRGERQVVDAHLDRDPASPLWGDKRPPQVVLEIDGAAGLTPVFGGDIVAGCTGSCSESPFVEARGVLRGSYQLRSGLGFGLDAGYAAVFASTKGRATQLQPVGLPNANLGTANDDLELSGLTLGASAFFHFDSDWPVTLRIGAGALLGEARDARTGSFTTANPSPTTPIETYRISPTVNDSVTCLYVVPEARIGRRVSAHLEITLGLEVLLLAPTQPPKFPAATRILAGPGVGAFPRGDGEAHFQDERLVGSLLVAFAPSVGARYGFW